MRKYALLPKRIEKICKVMLYDSPEEGTFVFLYDSIGDTSCFADNHFENLKDAEDYCKELGVNNEDWCFIDDPLEGCQSDLIKCK